MRAVSSSSSNLYTQEALNKRLLNLTDPWVPTSVSLLVFVGAYTPSPIRLSRTQSYRNEKIRQVGKLNIDAHSQGKRWVQGERGNFRQSFLILAP